MARLFESSDVVDGRSHVLYRCDDADGWALYIGATSSLAQRMQWHSTLSRWWGEVEMVRLRYFDDRGELLVAERVAIQEEQPRHNTFGRLSRVYETGTTHSPRPPR